MLGGTRMLRRPIVIVALLVLAAVLWWVHQSTRLPPGVETKGPQDWVPWVSLAGSIASFATALVTLGLKLIEVRQKKV
jgi:purine-cytosine permease-like protein